MKKKPNAKHTSRITSEEERRMLRDAARMVKEAGSIIAMLSQNNYSVIRHTARRYSVKKLTIPDLCYLHTATKELAQLLRYLSRK